MYYIRGAELKSGKDLPIGNFNCYFFNFMWKCGTKFISTNEICYAVGKTTKKSLKFVFVMDWNRLSKKLEENKYWQIESESSKYVNFNQPGVLLLYFWGSFCCPVCPCEHKRRITINLKLKGDFKIQFQFITCISNASTTQG